jgi:hypothetical protein
MQNRVALIRNGLFTKVIFTSLVISMGSAAPGCGGDSGTAAKSEMPAPAKNMMENMKNQAALQKAVQAKGQRPRPGRR